METFSSLFGGRLKEVRKDLSLSQSEAAELVGVTREHWGRCERGIAVPGGEVLAALAAAGADVFYILTGERSKPVPAESLLPEGERILLDNYRHAPAGVQAGVKTTLGAFAPGRGTGRKAG